MKPPNYALLVAGLVILGACLALRRPGSVEPPFWYPPAMPDLTKLILAVGPVFGGVIALAGLAPLAAKNPVVLLLWALLVVVGLVSAVVLIFTRVPAFLRPEWLPGDGR